MEFKLRKTTISDIDKVMDIYKGAQQFMHDNGNPNQWGFSWPSNEKIIDDINKQISYVVIKNDEIVGVFAFVIGVDPTYINIRNGAWLSNKTYGTIHRLASSFKYHGIFEFVQKELEKLNVNFRIDTHENNKVMIHQIEKLGYKYCGIITPIEGGERLAFEKIIDNKK